MKKIGRERERLVSLYRDDIDTFKKEKVDILNLKIKLEEEMYSYDTEDPSLYDFLDNLSEEVYGLSERLSLYHWVENEMQKDYSESLRLSEACYKNGRTPRTNSEDPKKTIIRWRSRASENVA